jgi:hypothetical protein
MSDAIEKTAAGATRSFFGALGFILLMVGVEGMTGAAGIQFGVGLFLALLGALCFFAFFFWETAKKVLSVQALQAIGRFSQSRITWFGMVFLAVQTLILSRFVEERRWPFSFPADPQVYKENDQLKSALLTQEKQLKAELLVQENQLGNTKVDADKWRFANRLRNNISATIIGNTSCTVALGLSKGNGPAIWAWLQPMLDAAHWEIASSNVPGISNTEFPPGITILVGTNSGKAFICATALAATLREFTNYRPSAEVNQVTPALIACNNECVELDIGN